MKKNVQKNKHKTKNNKLIISYGIAEAISKIIIDKMISNAVINSRNNYINKKANNYYFKFMKKLIDSFLNIRFINHETCFNNNSSLKNNNKNKYNESVEITEPLNPSIDRTESTKIKFNFYSKNKKLKNKILSSINEAIENKKINSYENRDKRIIIGKHFKIKENIMKN